MNEAELAAGEFSGWLSEMHGAMRGDNAADVPCAGCTVCCTASQFVHIDPDETDALAHIPAELLFPAPGRPSGHVLMGYDERGHCPMLVDNQCSIYEHRPRTCRTYDCRVFAATGIEPDQALIRERTVQWRFSYDSPASVADHDNLRAHAQVVEGSTATERAVVSVRTYTPASSPGRR